MKVAWDVSVEAARVDYRDWIIALDAGWRAVPLLRLLDYGH
jgi:hypothetical protein